jgi:hypothetical protein
VKTGDVILTGIQAQGWISRLIKLGALVGRYPADARRFSHCALVVGDDGTICEAVERGVKYSHVTKYKPSDYVVIEMDVDEHDAEQIRAFTDSVVQAHNSYGIPSFVACGINCLLAHFKWRPIYFGVAKTKICSSLVACALTRAGVIWDKPEEVVMPADIWMHYGPSAN